jgi:hypothetical protein
MGDRLRARQRRLFALDVHVERLEHVYASVLSGAQRQRSSRFRV